MKRLSYCVSILLIYIEKSYCVPEPNPGEKIKFNAEDFEKLAKYANLTKRDHTAKNVNFAWKVTMGTTITTTTDPRHTSTLNEELSKKNSEIYDKLFAQLAYTLRDKVYLDRWLNEMDKGYHIFLYELQKQDLRSYFIKDGSSLFNEDGRDNLWQDCIDYLTYLETKDNFLLLLEQELKLGPSTTTENIPQELKNKEKTVLIIHECLVPTFRNPKYRQRWNESNSKGYSIFIKELKTLGYDHFIYNEIKNETIKTTSEKTTYSENDKKIMIWDYIVTMLEKFNQDEYERYVKKIDELPINYNDMDLLISKEDITNRNEIGITKNVIQFGDHKTTSIEFDKSF